MGADGDGRISANIGAERKNRVRQFADKYCNGSLTRVVTKALDFLMADEARERAAIPPFFTESIKYICLIMHTGSPEQDWALLQQEVNKLWENLQSLS